MTSSSRDKQPSADAHFQRNNSWLSLNVIRQFWIYLTQGFKCLIFKHNRNEKAPGFTHKRTHIMSKIQKFKIDIQHRNYSAVLGTTWRKPAIECPMFLTNPVMKWTYSLQDCLFNCLAQKKSLVRCSKDQWQLQLFAQTRLVATTGPIDRQKCKSVTC